MIAWLDWIAAVSTFVGVQLVAMKKWQGWALHAVNAILWAYLMVQASFWGLFTLELVFFVQALWALRRWLREP